MLKPGDKVLRLTWYLPHNGERVTRLYQHDTEASHHEDNLKEMRISFTREWVKWDGIEHVNRSNGD